MIEQKAANIFWHGGNVSKEDREKALRQKGVVLWLTGLSGSGKSTLARAVEKKLFATGHLSYVLDGDNIRFGLNKNLGFSPADRTENIRRIGEVARLFADAGIITVTAFISPYRQDREAVRALLGEGEFVEVYVRCPLEECERRDVKGLYKKARAGELKEFTGVSAPYEEPSAPELVLDTAAQTLEESVAAVISYLQTQKIIDDSRRPEAR